jgi:hypothetical protein
MRKLHLTLAFMAVPALALALAGADGPPAADKDKDKKKKAPAKVYTDEDLKNAKGNVTVLQASPDPDAPPAPHGEGGPPPSAETAEAVEGRPGSVSETGSVTSSGDANRDEESWRGLARDRWAALRDAEANISRIQAEIDEITLDRTPNPPDLLDPDRLQKRESAKARLMEQLERARQTLSSAQEALDDLRRRANLAHVPVSWLDEPPRE